jgi:hypothetical protein
MTLVTEKYQDQLKRWPACGRHILAHFDESSVVVYQAYRPEIGGFAVKNQRFGGEFSFNRMSWIKPNFLWMMYRSGWGTKLGQEITLAIHLQRAAFEKILGLAVYSTFVPQVYGSYEGWKERLAESPVRIQWDPDHDPTGAKQERRAIQLGMAGDVLRRFANEWILKIEDISDFVSQQRQLAESDGSSELVTPREEVYRIENSEVASRLGVDSFAQK